jgi:probable phosphoglycerate mutase
MGEAQSRIVGQIEAWRKKHPAGRVVAVSHGDIIKAAICHYLGLSLSRHDSFDIDPASCSAVVVWEGGGKVLALNAKEWP